MNITETKSTEIMLKCTVYAENIKPDVRSILQIHFQEAKNIGYSDIQKE